MAFIIPYKLDRYTAKSWSVDNGTKDSVHGRFYMAEEVNNVIHAMETKYEFEQRKWEALEAFYLKEIQTLQDKVDDGDNSYVP